VKILHLDIETAPNRTYTWGLFNQNIGINQIEEPGYTLCFAAKWHGKSGIIFESIHSEKRKGDMVRAIHKLLEEADAVVHYNGTKFDIPTLNKEFLIHGLEAPAPYREIDLIKVVRSRFRFTSNKLDYVSRVLKLGGKTPHKGMELWKECMAGNDAAWKTMKQYNIQDVRLLERLYKKLLPWIKNHPNYGLYVDNSRPVCKNCGSTRVVKKGIEITAVGKYQRYRCSKCKTPMRGATMLNNVEERRKLLR